VKKIVLLVFTLILFLSCVGIEFQSIKCVGAADTWRAGIDVMFLKKLEKTNMEHISVVKHTD